MSHSAEYEWRQRQEDRRRQYLNRVRAATTEFVTRYENVLADVSRRGLDSALPVEFANLSRQVAEVRRLLSSDPERARSLSLSLGSEVHALPRLAVQAQRHAEEQAAQRRKQLSAELTSLLDRTLLSIADPIVRDFAYMAAEGIEAEIKSQVSRNTSLDNYHSQLQLRMAQIVSKAEAQADDWKRAQRSMQGQAVRAEVLADAKEVAMKGSEALQEGARAKLATALDQVNSSDEASFDAAINAALECSDQVVVDEESRRAAVRAIYESLLQAGFAVDAPYLEQGSSGNVVVSARKPAGGQAQFRISVEGELVYKFDHYEGAACKQDLGKVMPMLQQIYGITLSNERVLWDNPDRLSRDARPLDDQEAQQ